MATQQQSLLEQNLVKREIDAVSSTGENGVGVDMQGWDGVVFILTIGAGAATKDYKAQSDTAPGFGTAADIAGSAITQLGAGVVNKVLAIDVYRPTNRYVRSVFAAGGAVVHSAISVRYRATGRLPVTQDQNTQQLVKVLQN